MSKDHYHHFQKRKRTSNRGSETGQQHDKLRMTVDKMIYVVVFLAPALTIPQVLDIWVGKDASGVSGFTWATYIFTDIFWLVYGFLHREKPIILSSVIWISMQILIVVGTLLYG